MNVQFFLTQMTNKKHTQPSTTLTWNDIDLLSSSSPTATTKQSTLDKASFSVEFSGIYKIKTIQHHV